MPHCKEGRCLGSGGALGEFGGGVLGANLEAHRWKVAAKIVSGIRPRRTTNRRRGRLRMRLARRSWSANRSSPGPRERSEARGRGGGRGSEDGGSSGAALCPRNRPRDRHGARGRGGGRGINKSNNGGHDDEGQGDGSSGGRAGRAEPAGAALCPCNRCGARGRGGGRGSDCDGHDDEEHDDGISGGREDGSRKEAALDVQDGPDRNTPRVRTHDHSARLR